MNHYHLEQDFAAACGMKVRAAQLVDIPVRVDCPKCRRVAGLDPLPVVAVAKLPPRDVVLKELLEVLCKVVPLDRRELAEEALLILSGGK